MRTVIFGGAGFLGSLLARSLLDAPDTPGDPAASRRVVIADRVAPAAVSDPRVETVGIEMGGPADALTTLVAGAGAVVHLAAVVSADAEAAPQRAWEVNVDASRRLLAACADAAAGCRFLTASSLAVFTGGAEPSGDRSRTVPASTYGLTKAVLELLVNEATRRGHVDGRTARLPTVVIRPGSPNLAASSFASGLFREPLAGIDSVVPVGPGLGMVLIGHRAAVAGLAALLAVPADRLGPDRAINLPGLQVSVAEMIEAARTGARRHGIAAGRISVEVDPRIEAIVGSWPSRWESTQAASLGLPADNALDQVVDDYLADFGPASG